MKLIPVDPNSQVFKDLMAVNAANTQPEKAGTRRLIPVDPSSPEFKAIMSSADIKAPPPPGAPSETRVHEVQQSLKPPPRPMGAVSDISIEGGKASLVPSAQEGTSGSWVVPVVQTAMGFNPYGRAVNAAIGAGGSVAGDIYEGRPISVGGALAGGIGGALGPELATAGKFVLRNAGRIFGSGPLKKAAGTIYDETKALTKSVATPKTEQEIMKQTATFGRTAQEPQVKEVTDIFDKITAAKNSGQPLTYGEVFNRTTQLNQAVDDLFTVRGGRFKEAAGELRNLSAKMMEDLATAGPEAAKAVETYKKAVGLFGGPSGVMKAIKNATGLGIGITTAATAAMKPATMVGSVPAAIIGGIINLSERLPFGVGQGIARALITEPGKMSKGAVMALTQAVNEQVKEY